MKPDIRWLARLSIEEGLLTKAQCRAVRTSLGDGAEIGDFAQKLIDEGLVENIEILEKLAGVAISRGGQGSPTRDPFAETRAPFPTKPPFATKPPLAAKQRKPIPAPSGDLSSPDQFPFDALINLTDSELEAAVGNLLRSTSRIGASDLHLSTGARPFVRRNRVFTFIGAEPLSAEDALRLNMALLSPSQKKLFLERRDYDYALALSSTDRYRVNLMFHKDGVAGSYRIVPDRVRTLTELGFAAHNETLKKLLSYHNGLVLVTGPVGSGKTSTLASMVSYLNETRTDHIITVEDPIEFVQEAKGCNVTQREVGPHTKSFATALKGALREDPDVIVIGELRDLETIEMAISASETGHLVIGTMHTSDATTTLNRLLDVFPPAQQTQIRGSVAESLRGIVCQRLLPANEGGLTLACEIMVSNTAIQNLIREGKSTGLRNAMETGVRDGMCLMDNVIFQLWQQKKISAQTALGNIANRMTRAKIS
ncbi:MAG: PilT/PilU family type 4a pilus ATPase [Opitutaceae bacterium]